MNNLFHYGLFILGISGAGIESSSKNPHGTRTFRFRNKEKTIEEVVYLAMVKLYKSAGHVRRSKPRLPLHVAASQVI
jgi:hypothetical protein